MQPIADAVVHRGHILSNLGAQILTEQRVFYGNTPCVQLDRAEAMAEALVGNIEKRRRVPKRNRAGIGGNRVPGPADDSTERQTSELGREIPDGDVDRAERVEGRLVDSVDLPNLPPDMLSQQGIPADEEGQQAAVVQIDHDRVMGAFASPVTAFYGANRDLGGDGVRSRTRKPLTPDVLMFGGLFNDSVSTAMIFIAFSAIKLLGNGRPAEAFAPAGRIERYPISASRSAII